MKISRKNYPRIITGYDLMKGEVLFFTGNSWSVDLASAIVISNPEEVSDSLDTAVNIGGYGVVDIYTVDVILSEVEGAEGLVVPVSNREKMRLRGPSHKADLSRIPYKGVQESIVEELFDL